MGGKGLCGFLRVLGNLGGKKEGCVLLEEGPLVGANSLLGLQTEVSPPPKKLDDVHLLGCVGVRRWALLSGCI